ncbi:hypothetical protein A2454_01530 [Candidatus Peribacteria bacterium RIFOXYC2_FULL_55_14]|nr:MAG: hypothetical protein UY85_C0033G0009 [Candidatus Peribacteria bacterium GW2011_GWB1_54_5]OGJ72860.1 MAG: hypothetical protein A2198_00645 [Candidatus Peribacteria bacterium RIFOXYA1_FULL_56_14]OGJ73407.1 MAG: hypothetical protein A2217_01710 [Candidatus Peribacteria bacterium RIFOXYA2_FULL_55_28]OGJ74589.1 MAG: hypothetical protein A2384_03000 [Candidatus Peribacteria bacterium RIFOXYB1_FULL_54_35]OGJ77635.1 MAG: hypothetical protein A2327_05350 [Candidatus Peribacteria bacterium RIFOXY
MASPDQHNSIESSPQSNIGTPQLFPRRDFLAYGAMVTLLDGTAASDTECLSPPSPSMHNHPDMTAELKTQIQHGFNKNPEKWLEEHGKEFDACFDCSNDPVTEVVVLCIDERMLTAVQTKSGVRVLRMAGSGVLFSKQPTEDLEIEVLADSYARYIRELAKQSGQPVDSITLKITSHKTCGAAGEKFGETSDDPDESARVYQKKLVAALKKRGIRAEFTNDVPMNGKTVHNTLGTIFDLSGGRFQRLPMTKETIDGKERPVSLNTFVVSPTEDGKGVEDALLSLKIASGSHSYGEQLPQYTFLALMNSDEPERSAKIIRELTAGVRPYEAKGIKVKIVTREAPAVKK